ncbi:CLUMA_CG020622, isoform A [Clunio marinus]|uniref:CLUMA_CG020622, isoform A n=1 Tax=Clunio marinus TaxID=568069 RepID=A0A1J1J5J6_9DIPT|nr:CLUMA_CG020622, isoform A [Clunio marinus]
MCLSMSLRSLLKENSLFPNTHCNSLKLQHERLNLCFSFQNNQLIETVLNKNIKLDKAYAQVSSYAHY